MARKYLPILFVFFLLVLTVTAGFFFYSNLLNRQIVVINQDQRYVVLYSETEKFLNQIDSWGFWDNDGPNVDDDKSKINKVEIIFSDKEQTYFKDKDSKDRTIWSSNYELTENGVFRVFFNFSNVVFQESSYFENENRILDKFVLSGVLQMIYHYTHTLDDVVSDSSQYTIIENSFFEDESTLPFYVEISNE